MADSTEIAMNYDWRVAAKVFKCFLTCSSRIIKARGGKIRSFDGDRVMGIFLGSDKNTRAGQCALQISYAFTEVIKPKLEIKYPRLRDGTYELPHCVGVDTSEVWAVRGGVVKNNDLVWVDRAPNLAAKLSALRYPLSLFHHSGRVHRDARWRKVLPNDLLMWSKRGWGEVEGIREIYGSSWWMLP